MFFVNKRSLLFLVNEPKRSPSPFTHKKFPEKIRNRRILIFSENFQMGKTGLFDLEKHFAFYGAYHSNPVNIAIHMLFVWPILFTSLLILYFTPSLLSFAVSVFGNDVVIPFNIGLLLTIIYSVFYICLDAKAGSLGALLCVICWVGSCFLGTLLGFSISWKVRLELLFIFVKKFWVLIILWN